MSKIAPLLVRGMEDFFMSLWKKCYWGIEEMLLGLWKIYYWGMEEKVKDNTTS